MNPGGRIRELINRKMDEAEGKTSHHIKISHKAVNHSNQAYKEQKVIESNMQMAKRIPTLIKGLDRPHLKNPVKAEETPTVKFHKRRPTMISKLIKD